MGSFIPCEFIRHVPVEQRESGLYALGVWLILTPPCRIPDRESWKIEDALSAKAAADGVNMPVALSPRAWLLRCRRCAAPFIGMPWAKLCSDECRAAAIKDTNLRSKAKRGGRHESRAGGGSRFICVQCGKRSGVFRPSKRFCSVKCRVAAHRGQAPTREAWTPDTRELVDRQIADTRSILGAAQCGYLDRATLKGVMDRALALQAERDALDQSTPPGQ